MTTGFVSRMGTDAVLDQSSFNASGGKKFSLKRWKQIDEVVTTFGNNTWKKCWYAVEDLKTCVLNDWWYYILVIIEERKKLPCKGGDKGPNHWEEEGWEVKSRMVEERISHQRKQGPGGSASGCRREPLLLQEDEELLCVACVFLCQAEFLSRIGRFEEKREGLK